MQPETIGKMKKKFICTILALTVALTSVSFASAAAKTTRKVTVGTPQITYVGCGFQPYHSVKNITTEDARDTHGFTIDWTAVKGATGYEPQINYKRNGKWSGWINYYYDKDGNFVEEGSSKRCYFYTYEKGLKEAKAELKQNAKNNRKKGYIWRGGHFDKNGDYVQEKYTLNQFMKKFYSKTRAEIAVWQDDTVYKFRVRAYKTVNGKKVYGKWSTEQTAKEKITAENIDYIFESVQKNVKAWAQKNYPNFVVEDRRDGAWDEAAGEYPGSKPEGGSYHITGSQRTWFSRYATPEAVTALLTESYTSYIDGFTYDEFGGNGYMFIRKMRKGSPMGLGGPQDETDIYYLVWILK